METLIQTTLQNQFIAAWQQAPNDVMPALNAERTKGFEFFMEKGFPTLKDEEWKYTNIQSALKKNWVLNAHNNIEIDFNDIKQYIINQEEHHLLLVIDGKFYPEYSSKIPGAHICSLQEAYQVHHELFMQYFSKQLSTAFNAFTALNTALANEGLFIYVPKNTIINKPIEILNLNGFEEEDVFTHSRNLIIIESSAELSLLQHSHSFQENATFTNVVSECFVGAQGKLNYHTLQLQNADSCTVNTVQIVQEKDSLCNTSSITLGGKMVRNDLNFRLVDKNCESHLYGLYLPAGKEHFDHHTFVDHASPNCYSNEFYKGIMMEQGTAVFNGKIIVREGAQKTNAFQSNKNILLSSEAKIDTKPQLEIFADDVKCSHGATVGQLDEEALFYLQSRGIGKDKAYALLVSAFAQDVLQQIALTTYKTYLENLIEHKLKSMFKD